MSESVLLKITGEVERPAEFTFADLAKVDAAYQVVDVSRIDPCRQGDAVALEGLLSRVGCKTSARYLGLHASSDDYHASIPLSVVREQSLLIYRHEGRPLSAGVGGPVRFYIRDSAACHTDEVDECANVKFVDHIELTAARGVDNRPDDDEEHEALHRGEDEA
jgi:DMSO/TMAO reductase YedYZ molybdopterin-dependent catalytic subunit